MSNLYLETAQAAVPTPPLAGDARADVVVVGGGFTGLSTALHLAEQGVRVILLEAHEPGWGASGRNGGQVNPGLRHDPDVVERDFGDDLGRRMNALAGGAPALVFDLVERHGIACEARRNGTLRAAVGARHAALVRTTAEKLHRRGAPVEVLEGAALAAATGTDRYAVALLDRRGGDVNPLSYARGLARAALRAGAAVHGGTRALALTRVDAGGGANGQAGPRTNGRAGASVRAGTGARGWALRTPSGTVTADTVVLATNGYTDDLWPGLRRTVVPVFGAIAASAPLRAPLAKSIMPGRSVLYESGAVTVYYRIDGDGRLLIGGRGPQREVGSTAALAHLRDYAEKLWPDLPGTSWMHAWGGRLAMTRDQYPHIHEPAPGLLMCLGYNGRGVALGTAMGVQLASRIAHPDRPFDMPISGLKPIGMHAFWPLAVRAAIARGRLMDFAGL